MGCVSSTPPGEEDERAGGWKSLRKKFQGDVGLLAVILVKLVDREGNYGWIEFAGLGAMVILGGGGIEN